MRFLLALALLFTGFAHADEELLEPEQAFKYSASLIEPGKAEARFQIADGYYLYRNKIKFSAEAGIKLGTPALPAGKIKQDEAFGKVEIYRGDIRVQIPYTPADGAAKPFKLSAEFQGCADLGVCYQPQNGVATIGAAIGAPSTGTATPAAAPAAMQQQNPEILARLKSLAGNLGGGSAEAELMPPEEAFKLALTPRADGNLDARFSIANDHYLYRDKIVFKIVAPAGISVAGIDFPPAEEKNDPSFGKTFVYHQSFTAVIRLAGTAADAGALKIEAAYQGCNEAQGICFPPQDQLLEVAQKAPVGAPAAKDTSDTGRVTAILAGGNYWLVIVSFFGFGLLLSLTPCVFPMIPILSGIIVGQGQQITKRKGFLLSLAYVLGMAVTYAMAGVAAGLSGTLISNALQNPWALGTGAAIFVALAMSMFGFFELQMPSFLQSRFTEASNRIQGGRFTSVFVMGAISALIVGPCVAAPLAGALLYISQTSDVVLGGVSLFSLALGMGVPLLLIGLSAGALLPRAGGWMDAVKRFFGVALLAVAIWLVSPLLSEVVQMLFWAALLIVSAMFLHALEPVAINAKGYARFWKGVGIIALVAGIALLLGALGGGRDLLQPLSVFKAGGVAAAEAKPHLAFQRVNNVAELDAAIQGAGGRAVMLDFYADWCISCKEMEKLTFSDAKVQAKLKDVLLLQADVTANGADDKALLARFKLFGPPGIVFFDKTGAEIAYRVVGYEPAEKFLDSLGKALP
ncbi:MAG: thiol:disulfide interchange protein [Hydrogenophilales bacterium 28-61-23]|nr:MAG: thiol:disulfide interchange protein [Hydrogenophilales bacterium 28-61-23]